VAASIQRFGWQQPIVAKPSGELIAGNTRLKAAKALGMTTVPVVWFEGADLEAAAFCVADNRTHEFSDWDDQAAATILQELQAEDVLDGVGFTGEDLNELLASLDDGGETPVELDDPGPVDPTRPGHPARGPLGAGVNRGRDSVRGGSVP
jgi:ParB-like chromosome segregation protein Spo0J